MNFLSSSSSSDFSFSSSSPSVSSAARASLSLQEVRRRAPAVFAEHAAGITGPRYVFISTRDIVMALMDARGRVMHTRGIRAIRENVRLNAGLWSLALQRIGR